MLRALHYRNYRLFFAGQSTSLVGTWLTRVATSWLVYRLSHSAWLLGIVGFCGQIPTFVLSPLAGVLVDRWNRHRTLVITQILSMVQSALLAALALTGRIQVVHVALLSVMQGLINAFDTPARQAFLVEMVEGRDDLPNAIALNSSMVNAARLLGPSAAGILIAAFGEGGCFLIDAVSYLAVIASLLFMQVRKVERRHVQTHVLHELKEGFDYASRFAPVRSALLLLALVSLVGMPYMVLLPIIAGDRLGGGAHTLGYLTAASGLGALAGALFLASRRSVLGLGRIIMLAAAGFGAALAVFAASRSLWISLPVITAVGFAMMVQMAASNTVLQTIVEEHLRGRLMSFYTMAFMGTAPFGSLLAGWLAARIGAPLTLELGGGLCVLGAAYFGTKLPALREMVRPIYMRMGVIPDVEEVPPGAQ